MFESQDNFYPWHLSSYYHTWVCWNKWTGTWPRKHGVRGSIDPHFFKWGSKNTFWPPLLTCTKPVYCSIWVTIMLCTINAIYSFHYTHKIDTFMSYNPCIECYGRMIILCSQKTENIHQINNECNPSRASSFAMYQDRADKMDLNDLCQTFVRSRSKHRESLFGI